MNTNWIKETCASCKFMVDGFCRESPPSLVKTNMPVAQYPTVYSSAGYQNACSRHKTIPLPAVPKEASPYKPPPPPKPARLVI